MIERCKFCVIFLMHCLINISTIQRNLKEVKSDNIDHAYLTPMLVLIFVINDRSFHSLFINNDFLFINNLKILLKN